MKNAQFKIDVRARYFQHPSPFNPDEQPDPPSSGSKGSHHPRKGDERIVTLTVGDDTRDLVFQDNMMHCPEDTCALMIDEHSLEA